MAKKLKSRYSVHPGVEMVQRWISDLKDKTGRSLEEWLRFINTSGPKDEAGRRAWLKTEHGLGTNSAWWLAERSLGKGGEEDSPTAYLTQAEKYVAAQYEGAKKGLTPIFNALLELGLNLGPDVKACPCKTMVPLYRKHVFAQIKPTTRTRVDLGLALRDLPFTGRLLDTGGLKKKDRITHRIAISSVKEIDGEVRKLLRLAYELDVK